MHCPDDSLVPVLPKPVGRVSPLESLTTTETDKTGQGDPHM
uniref:Uncharacterized protein n=1 Tax=Anguilla anguilla TaxID=7936 RepID=A0A0E9PNK4_ANGAN